ncbi:hypothetical protein [Bifidobacterium canis]|uniref:hypothetical protein n=1 Tax=Bifidobacterium canis TaxID=2610880 RepID=UPI001FE927F8|nr:hypothetical protein [Bifidobacterium canis]
MVIPADFDVVLFPLDELLPPHAATLASMAMAEIPAAIQRPTDENFMMQPFDNLH